MYISGALCQMGRSKSIVRGSYVYIRVPMSGGMAPEYITGVPMYISRALWQMGRYQSVVLGPYLYIQGPMSGGKVPDYSTGIEYRYWVPYVRLDGPRV